MIISLSANDPRFKTIKFHKGLNVILADKKDDSDKKDSRNGIGKTTFIQILHFCLGANLNKNVLPVNELSDWVFYLEIDLCGEAFKSARSISNAKIIEIIGNDSILPIAPELDKKTGMKFYTLSTWRELLNNVYFGIKKGIRSKYTPSFRMLIPYFLRIGVDAYSRPFSTLRNQKSWQIQVSNAFLLGLNWEHASDVQILKDKNNAANALDTAIKSSIVPTKGELEAERVRLASELGFEKKQLAQFKVHPKYNEIETNVNRLTKEVHSISNANLILRRKLSRYQESVQSENIPEKSKVADLYEKAGVALGDLIKKTLADTEKFHSEIIQNRHLFLKAEIDELQDELEKNNDKIKELSNERGSLLKVLEAHGALDEFVILQQKYNEKEYKLESLKSKIAEMKSLTKTKKEIKSERLLKDSKIQRDYENARTDWEQAISKFNDNSLALYNHPGNLIINTSEKGNLKENAYKFDVEIPRSNSEGVSRMKIFCYDLMLVEKFSSTNKLDFLVHDSTMYDGVDSRQVALALEHAQRRGSKSGFQYICTMNSDTIPHKHFSNDFRFKNHVRLHLSDKKPEDSILGFRFEIAKKKK